MHRLLAIDPARDLRDLERVVKDRKVLDQAVQEAAATIRTRNGVGAVNAVNEFRYANRA